MTDKKQDKKPSKQEWRDGRSGVGDDEVTPTPASRNGLLNHEIPQSAPETPRVPIHKPAPKEPMTDKKQDKMGRCNNISTKECRETESWRYCPDVVDVVCAVEQKPAPKEPDKMTVNCGVVFCDKDNCNECPITLKKEIDALTQKNAEAIKMLDMANTNVYKLEQKVKSLEADNIELQEGTLKIIEEQGTRIANLKAELKKKDDRTKDLENCRAYWAKCDECPIHKHCSLMYEVTGADKNDVTKKPKEGDR